jgi:hypothetical protein
MSKSTTVGTIRKTEKGSILVLAKGITILKDGVEVPVDPTYKSLSLFDSTEGAHRLASMGIIDNEALTKKLEYIADKNIVRDIVAFPPKG